MSKGVLGEDSCAQQFSSTPQNRWRSDFRLSLRVQNRQCIPMQGLRTISRVTGSFIPVTFLLFDDDSSQNLSANFATFGKNSKILHTSIHLTSRPLAINKMPSTQTHNLFKTNSAPCNFLLSSPSLLQFYKFHWQWSKVGLFVLLLPKTTTMAKSFQAKSSSRELQVNLLLKIWSSLGWLLLLYTTIPTGKLATT